MSDVVEFLRARMGEDEAVAREFVACEYSGVDAWGEGADHFFEGGAGSPARVLADVEAKRRLVEHADTVSGMDQQIEGEWGTRGSVPWNEDEGVRILRLLALPYASHPDYRQEWAL